MPIVINPDGLTARFDTRERVRLVEQWNREAPVTAQTVSHNGAQIVALDYETCARSVDYGALEARAAAAAGFVARGATTGRTASSPRPLYNLPLRGRTATQVFMDDLEGLRMMGLTTRVHDELRIELVKTRIELVKTRDDVIDAALAWWRANHRPLPPVASRALVPVSALQQRLPAERFDKALLQEIDRPVHDVLLAERKRMREHWTWLMTEKAEALPSKGAVAWKTFHVTDATLLGMPDSPLMREVDRVVCMLVQDGCNVEDIVAFSLRAILSERHMPHVKGILLCYGVGQKDYHLISTNDFKGTP